MRQAQDKKNALYMGEKWTNIDRPSKRVIRFGLASGWVILVRFGFGFGSDLF